VHVRDASAVASLARVLMDGCVPCALVIDAQARVRDVLVLLVRGNDADDVWLLWAWQPALRKFGAVRQGRSCIDVKAAIADATQQGALKALHCFVVPRVIGATGGTNADGARGVWNEARMALLAAQSFARCVHADDAGNVTPDVQAATLQNATGLGIGPSVRPFERVRDVPLPAGVVLVPDKPSAPLKGPGAYVLTYESDADATGEHSCAVLVGDAAHSSATTRAYAWSLVDQRWRFAGNVPHPAGVASPDARAVLAQLRPLPPAQVHGDERVHVHAVQTQDGTSTPGTAASASSAASASNVHDESGGDGANVHSGAPAVDEMGMPPPTASARALFASPAAASALRVPVAAARDEDDMLHANAGLPIAATTSAALGYADSNCTRMAVLAACHYLAGGVESPEQCCAAASSDLRARSSERSGDLDDVVCTLPELQRECLDLLEHGRL
jgi:hypothetical protein